MAFECVVDLAFIEPITDAPKVVCITSSCSTDITEVHEPLCEHEWLAKNQSSIINRLCRY